MKTLPMRNLGEWKVSAMGLGCMPLSGMSSSNPGIINDRPAAIAVIHSALDAGITLLDTADIYAPSWDALGHNESLVGEAFASWSGTAAEKSRVVIATKGGITRGPGESWGRDGSRYYLLRAAEASAKRLGVNKIQLWQHHRLDTSLTFEAQFENVLALLESGIVEKIGVSNYNAEQLRRAIKIGGTPAQGGLISIQNEFSPRYRLGSEIFEICESNSIAFLPWSPLGGGGESASLGSGAFGAFAEVGSTYGLSAYATDIAWLLGKSSKMIPIPATTRISALSDTLQGVFQALSEKEMAQIEASLPPDSELEEELVDQPAFRS